MIGPRLPGGPWTLPRIRGAALVLACAGLLAGCTGVLGRGQGPTGGPAAGTPADTVAGADSASSAGDTLEAAAPGDSAAPPSAGNGGEAEDASADSAGAPSGPVFVTDLEQLAAMGPAYTPYDRPPLLQTGSYLEGLLRATILPVVEKHDLQPDEWARYWLLVDREGRVRDAVLQLTSGHAAFDGAARAAAMRLRYRPARREGETVPVWVLRRISLLMG